MAQNRSAASFTAACVQVNASDNFDQNIAAASTLVRDAAGAGADFVLLPENVSMMTFGVDNIRANSRLEADHPAISAFAELALDLGIWLHGGTYGVQLGGDGKHSLANRTIVFSPDGKIAERYDKIHMFDVDLSSGESYRESETFQPGDEKVSLDLPWGRLGLSTCYDVRFAYLYRDLAQDGADFLAVPSAFTKTTGQAHWHVLLRARAIETGCFVFAPAQTGNHFGDRQTFGHSLIINPWGQVIADAGDAPGFIKAEINVGEVEAARAKVPSLKHDRDYK